MAANPEPDMDWRGEVAAPRSRRSRGERAGRYVVEFREGDPPRVEAAGRTCRICGEESPSPIMHAVGDDIRRNACARCQGLANAGRL